jgi:hypothetical protein
VCENVHLCQRNIILITGLGLDTPTPTRASARACGTPFSFYQLHKWSTIGPPFKLVKILIGFQCGIESLTFILWTF